ncbi:MAG TPA: hypothetical protein VIU12_31920 [Chryseolinea sp.]
MMFVLPHYDFGHPCCVSAPLLTKITAGPDFYHAGVSGAALALGSDQNDNPP